MRGLKRFIVITMLMTVSVLVLEGAAAFAGEGCITGFNPPALTIPALGPVQQPAMFTVLTASPDCSWAYEGTQLPDGTLVSGFEWLGPPSQTSGTGSATVTFLVAPNPSPTPRSLTLFFDGQALPVTQAGNPCYLTISAPTPKTFPAAGGTGTLTIETLGSPCSYVVSGASQAVTILSGGSGSSFPATVTFSVPPNHLDQPTSHFLVVTVDRGPSAPYPLLVPQEANPCPLTFSAVTPTAIPANGGTGSFTVNTTASSCSYSVQAGDGVIIVSGGSGNAFPATVAFAVGANTSQNPTTRVVSASSLGTFALAPTVAIAQNGSPVATDAPDLGFIFSVHRPVTGSPYLSAAEPLRITNTEDPTASWSVVTSEPWLVVSPTAGASPATVAISLSPSAVAAMGNGHYTGAITFTSSVAPSTPRTVPVDLRITDATQTTDAPFGYLDVPVRGATGLSGAFAVSGWAIDDVGVARVQIFLSAAAGEYYLGEAIRVRGARPDVVATPWAHSPGVTSAGWGFMVLSNVLPNGGNGTFTFAAYAQDVEGHHALLGRTTVTIDNMSSTKPFGTIDLPGQGTTVSGIYNNQGWILAQPGRLIPFDGSTIRLFIDDVEQPEVAAYGYARPDVLALFPATTYANANGPALLFVIDTTRFVDGLHTIVWVATDDVGTSEGIGSRFINIQNGAASQVKAAAAPEARSAAAVRALPQATGFLGQRVGLDGWRVVRATGGATHEIQLSRGERVEVMLETWWWSRGCGPYAGYLMTGDVAGPLPAGASIDTDWGAFRWQPPVGFAGRYEFVFVRQSCTGREERIPLRIVLGPD